MRGRFFAWGLEDSGMVILNKFSAGKGCIFLRIFTKTTLDILSKSAKMRVANFIKIIWTGG